MAMFPHTAHVLHGLQTELRARRFTTVLLGNEDQLDREALGQHLATSGAPAAVAVVGEVRREFIETLRLFTNRIVTIGAQFPNLCHSVLGNEDQAVDVLVERLVREGHRRLMVVGVPPRFGRHAERLAAFDRAIKRHDLVLPPENRFVTEAVSPRDSAADVRAFLRRFRGAGAPTAVLCFNGIIARIVQGALADEGWRVPEEVSVVAVDASRICRVEEPTIACAAADPEKLGAAAARLLVESTGSRGENLSQVFQAAEFFAGATLGPAAAAGGAPKAKRQAVAAARSRKSSSEA